jgi:hypothetical protein
MFDPLQAAFRHLVPPLLHCPLHKVGWIPGALPVIDPIEDLSRGRNLAGDLLVERN